MNCTTMKSSLECNWRDISEYETRMILLEKISDQQKVERIMEIFNGSIEDLEISGAVIQKLKEDKAKLARLKDSLIANEKTLLAKVDMLSEKCALREYHLEEINREKKEFEKRIRKLVENKIALSSKNQELLRRISRLEKKISNVSDELNRERKLREQLENRVKVLNEENARLATRNEELISREQNLINRLNESNTERENIKSDLKILKDRSEAASLISNFKYSRARTYSVLSLGTAAAFTLLFGTLIVPVLGGGIVLLAGVEDFSEFDKCLEKRREKYPDELESESVEIAIKNIQSRGGGVRRDNSRQIAI